MAWLPSLPDVPTSHTNSLAALLNATAALLHEVRLGVGGLLMRLGSRAAPAAYDTLWLEAVLDLADPAGERALLTLRQCIRVRHAETAIVRELVWGDGDQLVRYRAAGARRLGVRPEGSKRAVLLSPDAASRPGGQLTITSQRTIRGGFRTSEEYFEAVIERPTNRLDLSVRFPRDRPPRQVRLILASTEDVVRRLRWRYGPDGRAVVHCRLRQPMTATIYSMRWTW